jgi:opacity protein-like surface antigen
MNRNRISILLAVLLTLALASSALAVTGLGIGAKAGVVTNYDNPNLKLSTYKMDDLKFFGGFLKLGAQGMSLELGVETFWKNKTINLLGNNIDVKARDLVLSATGKFYFKFPLIQPFVGAGIGAHKFTYSHTGSLGGYNNVQITIPDDKTYFGYHLVVGAKTAISVMPFDLFIEGKIGRVNTTGDPTKFTILSGGVIFNLP